MSSITGVRTISIPVEDQGAALDFYVDMLDFTLLRDDAMPNGGRWIELAPGGENVISVRPSVMRQKQAAHQIPKPTSEDLTRIYQLLQRIGGSNVSWVRKVLSTPG